MRVHAIQTGMVTIKRRQRRGKGTGIVRLANTLLDREWTEPLPIYAWVIEHPEGLIIVDTGETAGTINVGYFPAWHPYFRFGVRVNVCAEEEIGPQMRSLGLSPEEVRWVVMTHLHTDHAGGLAHFPKAEILVSRQEFVMASGLMGRLRGYLPNHWPSWFAPKLVDFTENPYSVFPRSLPLTKAGDVVLVPTPGHTAGHLSVLAQEDARTLLFAGDASYSQSLLLEQAIDGVSPDEAQAVATLKQIVTYTQQVPVVFLPSHDAEASQRLAGRVTVKAYENPCPSLQGER